MSMHKSLSDKNEFLTILAVLVAYGCCMPFCLLMAVSKNCKHVITVGLLTMIVFEELVQSCIIHSQCCISLNNHRLHGKYFC